MKILLVLLFALGCMGRAQNTETSVETTKIQIMGLRFEPKIIKVKAGTKVEWTNDSDQFHNMVGDGWESPYIYSGGKWTRTFDKKGTFEYYCTPHRTMGMTGKVIVE